MCKACKLPTCCAMQNEAFIGMFTKSATYKAELEDMLGSLVEDSCPEEPQRFDTRITKDFVGKSKKASLSKNVRALHLVYTDPATNTTQTALVIVDPREPLAKVIEMASRLECVCAAPVGYDVKTA